MSDQMLFEHFAINVADPPTVAQWYCAHLGMTVVRQGEPPVHMHFLADAGGRVVLEIYCNPPDQVPDYPSQDPQLLHIAFAAANLEADRARLLEAGATSCGEITTTPAGDRLAMLRDPWGFALQLTDRATLMVRPL
jgi:glyoxylase I family protein